VELAGDFAVDEDGNNDFGLGFEGAGEIAGIGKNVVHDDGFAGGGSGAADALIEGDAGVPRDAALEVAEDKDVGIFFKHVETDPVVTGELFVKESNDGFHEG